MFDTMTFTKVLGSFCGALLIFLLGGWLAGELYHTGGGHGEEQAQAYSIEVEDAGAGNAGEEEEQIDFPALVAAADPAAGEKVFAKCQACHKLDGTNATGPHLEDVVDRVKGSVDGFAYSDALLAMSGESWTLDNLNHFLESPRSYMPGTKMGFAGLRSVDDRAEVVAYLQSLEN